MRPTPWLLRGALAVAVPTGIALALLWSTAPPYAHNAVMYWVAADSQGTLYASDVDNGDVWVFDANGIVQGKLWPRRAAPGTPGPGLAPAGLDSAFTAALIRATPTPGGPTERELLFCGLAVDPQDHLYRWTPTSARCGSSPAGGQVQAVWSLPADYIPPVGAWPPIAPASMSGIITASFTCMTMRAPSWRAGNGIGSRWAWPWPRMGNCWCWTRPVWRSCPIPAGI